MADLSGQEDGGFVITPVDSGKNGGMGHCGSLPNATPLDRRKAASPQGPALRRVFGKC